MPEETPSKRMARAKVIYGELLDRIDSGSLKVGDYLPSERALIGEFGVSRPTVRKALQRLEREGYLVCHAGIGYEVVVKRARRSAPASKLIGVLWAPGDRRGHMDPRLPKLENELAARGYAMLLGFTGRQLGTENQRAAAFADQGVAGMIALPAQKGKGGSRLGELVADGFPVVAVGEPSRWCMGKASAAACSYVGIDNSLGSHLALDRLHELGHRRIAFARNEKNPLMTRRELGYRDWMTERKLDVPDEWVISCASESEGGTLGQLEKLLTSKSGRLTAVLCETVNEAERVARALEKLGVSIPGDISIAAFFGGIGDEPLLQGKTLAGLSYSWDELIPEIVATLISQIHSRSAVRRTLLRPEFFEGETLASPAEVTAQQSK